MMKTKFLHEIEKYDGSQLVSLRHYLRFGILGDSIVSWCGPCQVEVAHMVDGEDLLANAKICGDQMLHFTVEKFEASLFAAVGMQRLLASIVIDEIKKLAPGSDLAKELFREGDDIYSRDRRKLSISIATKSPVSALIHFAVNVTNSGTPVKTLSLEDLKIDAEQLAEQVMKAFRSEVESMAEATQKVRWVR